MKSPVDLHIHSCLSPCADDDMTPWNIVGMAKLKGLAAVAVCDHNSARNLPAARKAGEEYGVCVLPGIEVTSREDVHLLCYFETLSQAMDMGMRIEREQPHIKNKPELFGHQILVDEDDAFLGEAEHLLLAACNLSISDIAQAAWELGGVMVPAHINKGANSLLPVLGMLPENIALPTVEIFRTVPHRAAGKLCLHASDAHTRIDIREAEDACVLELQELTPAALIQVLRKGKGET